MAKQTNSRSSSTPPKRKRTSEAPAPVSQIVTKPQPSYDDIAARAYEVYQSRGPGEGNELSDWLKAEGELRL